jgi:hypothetical protein
MSFFEQVETSSLYTATTQPGDAGWLGFVLGPGATAPGPGIELTDALSDPSLDGSFVFCAAAPDLAGDALDAFVSAVASSSRRLVWVPATPPATWANLQLPAIGLSADGSRVTSAATAAIVPPFPPVGGAVTLGIAAGANAEVSIAGDGQSLELDGNAVVTFVGSSRFDVTQVQTATIPVTGPLRGCIAFETYILRSVLYDSLNTGMQFVFPVDEPPRSAIAEWLPMVDGSSAPERIGYSVVVDPSDPVNSLAPGSPRTRLTFTGENYDGTPTTLPSFYRTTFGAPVTLLPVADSAALVFDLGVAEDVGLDFQAAPLGDFVLDVDGASETCMLLCGLEGTEYVTFTPQSTSPAYAGDRLRFTPYRPAYCAGFPFSPSSPTDPPLASSPLLDATYTTSWAAIVPAPGGGGTNQYVAQPRGSFLYGRDALINPADPSLLGSMQPAIQLSAEVGPFPLAPYQGVTPGDGTSAFSADQIADFETGVVAATRRAIIGPGASDASSSRTSARLRGAGTGSSYNTTTPSGFLVTVEDEKWTRILLGQNLTATVRKLCFCNPDAELQQAFQTSQLFLVVANADHLGAKSGGGDGTCGDGAAFYNEIYVGPTDDASWSFAAQVGDNAYDDYQNVMILKGRPGCLYDPDDSGGLIANPQQWTQGTAFGAPSYREPSGDDGPPQAQDLGVLSYWLQRYFAAAWAQDGNEYFETFNRIATDPTWTGILVLRTTIAGLPAQLQGLDAGIAEPDQFYAHHLGLEMSQVKNSDPIDLDGTTSMFGLIYYVDSAFTPPAQNGVAQPVAPAAPGDYDFRVLDLKVLFENSAIKSFESYAQITLNRLFGSSVTSMGPGGNPYNTIVLKGAYQNVNGQPTYTLSSTGDNTFCLSNAVLPKVEVTAAQMSARGVDAAGEAVAWFGLSGFLDFAVVHLATTSAASDPVVPFDLFSFGSPDGQSLARQGLSFSNLGVQMTFPPAQPSHKKFTFSANEIRFDVGTSTPRAGSLYDEFALELQGLVAGGADGPAASGYLPVVTAARLTGVGDEWYGLQFQLNMGTPGNLAGTVGLTSSVLLAWSAAGADASSYAATVGLKLPGTGGGAKLISLQNVLTLSIGEIRLGYDTAKGAFLLMLSEIALKVLGVLKLPPSGSTYFYVFGNPGGGGKPSGLGWYAMYNREPKQGVLTDAR